MKTRHVGLNGLANGKLLERTPGAIRNGVVRVDASAKHLPDEPSEPVALASPHHAQPKDGRSRGLSNRASTLVRHPPLAKTAMAELREPAPNPTSQGFEPAENRPISSDVPFSEDIYLQSNPDVADAVRLGLFQSGLQHWLSFGKKEAELGLRSEKLEPAEPVIDDDLRNADENHNETPPLQTVSTPAADSARPEEPSPAAAAAQSPIQCDELGDEFFEELYLELNQDVAEAVAEGQLQSGFEHWALFGKAETVEGRRKKHERGAPSQSSLQTANDIAAFERTFDPIAYFDLYPDVLNNTDGSSQAARNHWLEYGRLEGRLAPGLERPRLRQVNPNKLFERPFGINIFGQFAAASGLGTVARAMAKAIKHAGVPFELWDYAVDGQIARPARHHTGRAPRYRVNLLLANADLTRQLFAAYPQGHFDDAYNIGLWQWELSNFRADWFYAFDGLDEVWTNSKFQSDAIKSLAPVPVSTIHVPVVASAFPVQPDRDRFGIPPDKFVFLMTFDVGSTSLRKNPFAAIEAFRTVAADHPAIHLVLKYHSPTHELGFTRRLAAATRGLTDVTLVTETLSALQMSVLRTSCDCLIAPHRSEGFGLHIAEFMSIGKPVIATAYSGNLDFFDDSVGFSVDYALTTVAEQIGPYRTGCVWAEPVVSSLAEKMQLVLTNRELADARAEAARRQIGRLLSLATVARSINDRLNALGLSLPPPPFMKLLARSDMATRVTVPPPAHDARAALISSLPYRPLMSVLLPVYNVPAVYLEQCIESVLQQTYPFWELCICNDGSTAPDTLGVLDRLKGSSAKIRVLDLDTNRGIAEATNRALEMSSGEFVVLLDNDDLLMPTALEDVVATLGAQRDLDVLYSDEDKIDPEGNRIDHFYKPDWSPEHLESVMYVLHMLVIRKRLILSLGGLRAEFDGAQDYDLMLRCSRATEKIHHIAKVLYRWRSIPGSSAAVVDAKPRALQNGMRALEDHGREKYGAGARAEPGLLPGTFRMRRNNAAGNTPVTLLILTGNAKIDLPGRGTVSMVDNFVDSILAKTRHENYQIVVIDNDTLSIEQKTRFGEINVRVENMIFKDGFNYAEKANFAVIKARTENIVLLNDDMEIKREDWLESLLDISTDGSVGAVGARLLHADGTIQHVGIVVGIHGGPAHIYHNFPNDFVGYNAFTHIVRNYSAVTAACLATRKSVVAQVGGFDERFAVDFNDVDFCLRLVEAGFRVAYTPYAELYHFENSSIKRQSQDPAEAERFRTRWARYIDADPHYNRNLTRTALDFREAAV
jgi:GT2 family glycosyltransferase/glycosyltransferase involved in cell wall biosynthesis